MKGLLVRTLLSCTLFAAAARGDTLVPANTLSEITSPSSAVGDVTVETGGRLKLSFSDSSILANNITNNGGVGDFSQGTTTISGAICGIGEFYKAGTGTTILSASNSYTGVTYLDAGTLQVGVANAISQQSPVFLNASATLDLHDLQQFVGSVSGSGSVVLGSAPLSAESGLVKLGGGRLALGANSGFSGATVGSTVTVGGSTLTSGCIVTMAPMPTIPIAVVGPGGLTKIGSGSLTLSGTNNYTGMLTQTGTLTLAATVSIGGSNNIIMSNDITGTGSLVKTGMGTLTLNGSNTYTGLTVLNSGTLNLAGSLTNPAIIQNGGWMVVSGTNFYGATLNLTGSGGAVTNSTGAAITIPGGTILAPGGGLTWAIAPGGGLTITGVTSGTLGSPTLSGTSLAVTVGSPAPTPAPTPAPEPNVQPMGVEPQLFASALGEPSLPTSSTNGTLITGADNTNRIFSGVISGNGNIIKTGKGWWNLTGQNTYSGLTTVADGGLVVNGSIPGDVFVWGGVLGGSGQIGGNVLNQAIVSPGNSPGTLTIAGDYDQASTGFLVIQLASKTVYDRLLVGGQAHLDGGVLVQYYNGFQLKRGDVFTFLNATGGVTGGFSLLVIPTDTLLSLGLVYDPNSVSLVTLQGSFAHDVPGLTPNERAVGRALDRVVNNHRVSGLIDELDSLSLSEVPGALEKIVPTELLTMFDASINSASVQADNLERRMEEVRGGSTGFSANGLHLANCKGMMSGNGDGKQAIGKDGKELAPAPLSDRWGFFINGSGEFVDEENTGIARGMNFTTGGISTGMDYRLCEHAAVGVTAGYANTSTNGRGDGCVKTDSGKLGLYGTVFDRGLFLNGIVGGGLNSYDTKRETIGGNARGDADGTDFNALLGTGYTYRKGGLSAGPIASVRYTWVGIDGFTESGSLAPLRYGDQSEESLKSTVGLQTSYAIAVDKVIITPEVRAQWQREYLEQSRSIGASFLPGGAFTVYGPEIGRDSLLLDAGFTVQLTSRVSVYAFYTGDLGRQNYTSHSVNGGIQMSF